MNAEINNPANTKTKYTLLYDILIKVDESFFIFGAAVKNQDTENLEYKTMLEISELSENNQLITKNSRPNTKQEVYDCVLKIENNQVVFGELTDAFLQQLEHMGIQVKNDPTPLKPSEWLQVIYRSGYLAQCPHCDFSIDDSNIMLDHIEITHHINGKLRYFKDMETGEVVHIFERSLKG